MAGETPDRTQQRDSTDSSDVNGAAVSNGSAASGERAADPRLAVSREREPRVDQVTAVFSTAALRVGGEASEEPEPEPETEAETEAAESAAEPESEVAETESDAEAEDGESGESGGVPEDARLRAAVAAWVAGTGDAEAEEPEAEAESESADEPEAEATDADAESETEATSEPEAEADDQAAPEAEDVSESEPEPESKPKPEPEPEPEPEESAADAEPPVDQATAVFKTLPRPVDQPTAMFRTVRPDAKLDADADADPDADAKSDAPADAEPEPADAKSDAKSDAAPTADKKPETPAERTSQFIALKPLDEPARKPAQPARPTDESKVEPKAESTPGAKPEPKAEPTPWPKAESAAAAAAPVHTGPERTAQQPLPPKAPIDLLAELTNRPPPAETPLRTVGRRIKIWTPLVLLLAVVFAVVQAVRPLPTPKLSLTAAQTVSFEGDKPQIPWPDQGQAALDVEGIGTFGTSGEQKPVPIASIAKVMTAYVILQEHPLKGDDKGPQITVDKQAEEHYVSGKAENESVVDVKADEKLSEYEAIQAIMLPSANNVAKLLARWDSNGDEKAFVQKMNDAAKKLGMKNTTFTDASGLDKTTVSTAEDLVKLGRAAMEIPVFKQISGQGSYKPTNGRGDPSRGDGTLWYNFNNLVPTVAVGIKTGTSTAAGGNLLFASKKTIDGKEQIVIGAALAQFAKHTQANIDEVTANSRKLMEAAEAALTSKTVVKKGDVVGQVDDGFGNTVPVVATKDVKAVGWPGLTVRLDLVPTKGEKLPNKAKAGTQVGVLTVGDGKGEAVTVPVALQSDLEEPGFGDKLTRLF